MAAPAPNPLEWLAQQEWYQKLPWNAKKPAAASAGPVHVSVAETTSGAAGAGGAPASGTAGLLNKNLKGHKLVGSSGDGLSETPEEKETFSIFDFGSVAPTGGLAMAGFCDTRGTLQSCEWTVTNDSTSKKRPSLRIVF